MNVWLARVNDVLLSVRRDIDYILVYSMARYGKWPSPTTLRRIAAELSTLADDIEAAMRPRRK